MSRTLRKFAVGGAAAVALFVGVPATPAFAIDRVPCEDRNDFARLIIDDGRWGQSICFANNGSTQVGQGAVMRFDTGANQAGIVFEEAGWVQEIALDRWTSYSLNSVFVYEVKIYS